MCDFSLFDYNNPSSFANFSTNSTELVLSRLKTDKTNLFPGKSQHRPMGLPRHARQPAIPPSGFGRRPHPDQHGAALGGLHAGQARGSQLNTGAPADTTLHTWSRIRTRVKPRANEDEVSRISNVYRFESGIFSEFWMTLLSYLTFCLFKSRRVDCYWQKELKTNLMNPKINVG